MSCRKWMAVVGLFLLLTAGKLLFPEQIGAWQSRLWQLLTSTADTTGFMEALGQSLNATDKARERIEVFYPATDVLEEQAIRLPSYPPL